MVETGLEGLAIGMNVANERNSHRVELITAVKKRFFKFNRR
jgi:hypothetical protein